MLNRNEISNIISDEDTKEIMLTSKKDSRSKIKIAKLGDMYCLYRGIEEDDFEYVSIVPADWVINVIEKDIYIVKIIMRV